MSKRSNESISEAFQLSFLGGGTTSSADCEYCGRTYFCSRDISSLEDDEYDDLEKNAAMNTMYVEVDHTVSYTSAFGKQYVWGCSCNALRPYEDMLLMKRSGILAYYKRLLDEEKKEVKQNTEDLKPFNDET